MRCEESGMRSGTMRSTAAITIAMTVSSATVCAARAAGGMDLGLRVGAANYSAGVGGTSVYGVNVRLPVPFLEVVGSVEYAAKGDVAYSFCTNAPPQCESRP